MIIILKFDQFLTRLTSYSQQSFDTTFVTPEFKGKSECIEYMCAKITLHTCIDSVNTKNSAKSV
jgi:hypothetical protein